MWNQPRRGTLRIGRSCGANILWEEQPRMGSIIYLVGLVVIVLAILSFIGLG